MSGPIRPPLRVEEEDGSPSVRPVNTIKVTDGTLTDDGGATVTLDTSGSGGSPATPAKAIQFNSDPAGTFSGSERLLFETGSNNAQIFMKSGASATPTELRAVDGWGLQVGATSVAGAVISQVVMFGENDAPEGIILSANNEGGTGAPVSIYHGELTTSAAGVSSGNLTITTGDDATKAKITLNAGANGDVDIQTEGTGITEIQNATTDNDTTLSVKGNGTGDAKINLNNPTKAVSLICDTNQQLKVQGGLNTFIFDASSATGGIQWPDGTIQTTAASGGASELSDLTDVLIDATNFTDGFLIQPNSNGAAPTTGTLSSASNNIGIGGDVMKALTTGDDNVMIGHKAGEKATSTATSVFIGSYAGSSAALGGVGDQSVLIGYEAGKEDAAGAYNTLIGYQAGKARTTGNSNTMMGHFAGGRMTEGIANTFFGISAGKGASSSATGSYNCAFGDSALRGVSTGIKNIAVGRDSGTNITTGSGNIVIGGANVDDGTADDQLIIASGDGTPIWIKGDSTGALTINEAYTLPTAVTGANDYVLTAQTDGSTAWAAAGGGGAATLGELTDVSLDITNFTDSLLIQTDSNGAAPTTGTLSSAADNIGIGASVLSTLISGSNNSVYGGSAGESITTSWNSTLIGQQAGKDVDTGYANTAVGRRSLYSATDGAYSVAVGERAGYWQNSDKNVYIGHKAGYGSGGTGDYNIVVGANSVSTGSGTGEGNVALGQGEHTSATGNNQLLISSGTAAVNWIRGDDAGACYQGDNATTWSTTSDQRLKREIVDATVGLDAINAIQIRNFRFIEKAEPIIELDEDGDKRIVGYDGENRYDLDPEPLRIGVIAQELMEVFPDAVKENALGHLIVNPDSINWALLKAVQQLSAKVDKLEDSE